MATTTTTTIVITFVRRLRLCTTNIFRTTRQAKKIHTPQICMSNWITQINTKIVHLTTHFYVVNGILNISFSTISVPSSLYHLLLIHIWLEFHLFFLLFNWYFFYFSFICSNKNTNPFSPLYCYSYGQALTLLFCVWFIFCWFQFWLPMNMTDNANAFLFGTLKMLFCAWSLSECF